MNQACWCPNSQRRFDWLRDAILEQLTPRDFIEHLWVAEFIEGRGKRSDCAVTNP